VIEFHLPGQLPSGKNAVQITRTGRRYPGDRFKKWRQEMFLMMGSQNVPVPLLAKPLFMEVVYTPSDKRRRDVPGMVDAILHLLEKWGLVADDAWIKGLRWHQHAGELPGAWIRISDLDGCCSQPHTPKGRPPSRPRVIRNAPARKSGSR
jgi:Holliday junction resolvase RusA-like endonuclease